MLDSLAYYLLLAFGGGLILNVMPCVLPVLTMKVFHVVESADQTAAERKGHGIAYTLGVVASFVVFAAIVIALKASGDAVGWGMQFRNPAFVAALCLLMLVFGLNGVGVFEFTVSMDGGDDEGGYLGSAINGVVASVMATPCSAPMLGGAATFALAAGTPWWQTLAIFIVIGLGLASPFALISFVPSLSRFLPRPGMWMVTFKKLMGFSLLGASLWLLGVLLGQIDTDSARSFLGLMFVTTIALWSLEAFAGPMASEKRRWLVRGGALAATVSYAAVNVSFVAPERSFVDVGTEVVVDGHINWAPFSSKRVDEMREANRPVFMDFTADWCVNCKTNEAAFIEVEQVRETLRGTGILPMVADMTNEEPEIEAWLAELGRSGIPAYAIYLPDGTFDLLPMVITTEMVVSRLHAASEAFPPSNFEEVIETCPEPQCPALEIQQASDETPASPADESSTLGDVELQVEAGTVPSVPVGEDIVEPS